MSNHSSDIEGIPRETQENLSDSQSTKSGQNSVKKTANKVVAEKNNLKYQNFPSNIQLPKLKNIEENLKEFVLPEAPPMDQSVLKNQKEINLLCNLVQMSFMENKKVWQYAVKFSPEIDEVNDKLKKKLVSLMPKDFKEKCSPMMQSGSFFYSPNCQIPEVFSYEKEIGGVKYKVDITRTKDCLNLQNIKKFTKENSNAKNCIERLLKTIILANPKMIQLKDGAIYDITKKEALGQQSQISVWNGHRTAAVITSEGLSVRINDAIKGFNERTALSVMKEIWNSNSKKSEIQKKQEITSYFSGKSVFTKYGSFKQYVIADVEFKKNVRNIQFEIKDKTKKGPDAPKKMVSLLEYYKIQYNIDIRDLAQPLFIVRKFIRKGNDNKNDKKEEDKKEEEKKEQNDIIYLVPELVQLAGITDENDKKLIVDKSKYSPDQKMNKISSGMNCFFNKNHKIIRSRRSGENITLKSSNEIREEWGLKFNNGFMGITARIMEMPSINSGSLFQFQLRGGRFDSQKVLGNVIFDARDFVCFTWGHILTGAKADINQMLRACSALGIRFNQPRLVKMTKATSDEIKNELKAVKDLSSIKMALVIVDSKTKSFYKTMKEVFCEYGVPSQFMVYQPNSKKRNLSYFSNVLRQMTVKLVTENKEQKVDNQAVSQFSRSQGELFRINFSRELTCNPTMLVGIDNVREGKKLRYHMSSSFNFSFNKYFTDDILIDPKLENAHGLSSLFFNAIENFKEEIKKSCKGNNNNKATNEEDLIKYYPQTIIAFIKGCNESQAEKLIKNEIPKIVSLFNGTTIPGYSPKLTIFSVNKNSDLKFFMKNEPGNNNSNNNYGNNNRYMPKSQYLNLGCGTIIDTSKIQPSNFSFYLQAPDVRVGTAKPVHYYCLYNSNKDLKLNHFEELAFNLSFYYWNYTGPVALPAPLKYAEKALEFRKSIIGKTIVCNDLKNTPYYI